MGIEQGVKKTVRGTVFSRGNERSEASAVTTAHTITRSKRESENIGSNVSQQDITYANVELQAMFDELESNAMKAENNYQGKYVEFRCKISDFDSDGLYISVEPINASEWNLTTAMCYIKNDTQKDFLLNKNVDDEITIKGKIKSIGELLGYTIDINEVY